MARYVIRNLQPVRLYVPVPINTVLGPHGSTTVNVAATAMEESEQIATMVKRSLIFISVSDDPGLSNVLEILPSALSAGSGGVKTRLATTANIADLVAGAPDTVDGIGLVIADRVLVKSQTTPSQNGLYEVVSVGTGANGQWARTTADTLAGGLLVSVTSGTANADTVWLLTADDPITVGTTALPWLLVGGAGAGLASSAPADVTKAAAAVGTATVASRADHKHDVATAAAATLTASTTNAEGAATSLARSDHTHAITANVAATVVEPDDVAAVGTSAAVARADHKHAIVAAAPVNIGTANAEGTATSFARSDHVHDLGNSIADPIHTNVADGTGLGIASVIRVAFTAGGGGAADDVTIYNANAPFAFRILDAYVLVSTVIAASTLTLRTATAGAGSAVSDAFTSATTGVKRNVSLTATSTIALNGTLVLRRSDNGVAGEVVVNIERI